MRKRGWSISAIARHVGRDRKTVRAHLSGERVAGQRRPAEVDPFDEFEPYVRQRLADDPHLWGTALFDEARALGYAQSCVTFVRKIRIRELRPLCGACGGARGGAVAIIDHPVGEECQSVLGASGRHAVGIKCSCWWVSCRIRGSSERGLVTAGTRRIWWKALTRCCDGWGEPLDGGGWTGWRRCWCRALTGYRPRSWESPNTTGLVSTRAHRGGRTAKA